MIKPLHNLSLFLVKNANFLAELFGENIFKIITSVPDILSKKFSAERDLYKIGPWSKMPTKPPQLPDLHSAWQRHLSPVSFAVTQVRAQQPEEG
jgi:hypothetical protein